MLPVRAGGIFAAICSGFVVTGRVDQVEAGELFLGFRERPVGDRHAPIAHAERLRRLRREQGLGCEQPPLFPHIVTAIQALGVGDRVELVLLEVHQAEIFHAIELTSELAAR